MWFRIEVHNYSVDRHMAVSQRLRDMGYTVINNHRQNCSWLVSNDPRDVLMLPLKLDGCEVVVYDDLQAALSSTHHKDFEFADGRFI